MTVVYFSENSGIKPLVILNSSCKFPTFCSNLSLYLHYCWKNLSQKQVFIIPFREKLVVIIGSLISYVCTLLDLQKQVCSAILLHYGARTLVNWVLLSRNKAGGKKLKNQGELTNKDRVSFLEPPHS